MKKIIILGLTNKILGEWLGHPLTGEWVRLWNVEMWKEIEKELEMEVDFEEWGKEDEEGDGWVMYGYDGLGVMVCDVDRDERKCMREYINLVKRKY